MNPISLSAMEKIIKNAGANRVSDEAKEELRTVLLEYAERVCERAVRIAAHTKRKTIKAGDIKLAKR